LPAFLGALEAAKAEAWGRLTVSQPVTLTNADENVSVEEAARRLGVSNRWIYKHASRLTFVRKIGRRVLCSARALAEWNDRQRG
jgi:excisionase family DNA binding protein